MGHTNIIVDKDPFFTIDTQTRVITNQSTKKVTLMKNDHHSERFTFELPRYIEGHDMSKCCIEVNFINTDESTKKEVFGNYTVDDLRINDDNEEMLIFSWLISQAATSKMGSLSFSITFSCIDEEDVPVYIWHTAIYTGISISNTICNDEKDTVYDFPTSGGLSAEITKLRKTVEDAIDVVANIYDKVITTQEEFDELISSDTWLGYKTIGLACDVEITAPIVIPETVRTFEGAGGTRIISVSLTNESYAKTYYLSTTGNVAVNNIDFNFNLDEELSGGIVHLYGVKGIQHIKNCRAMLYENVKQKSFGFLNAFTECRNMFECDARQGGAIYQPFVISCSNCSQLYGCKISGNNGRFSACKDMYGCVAENGATFDSCENIFGVNFRDVRTPMYMLNCKNISGIVLINTLGDASIYENNGMLCSCSRVSNVQLISNGKDSDDNNVTIEGIVDCSYVSNVKLTRATFSGANTKVDGDSCDYTEEEA